MQMAQAALRKTRECVIGLDELHDSDSSLIFQEMIILIRPSALANFIRQTGQTARTTALRMP
jgi:hypothetical protein